MPAIDWGNYGVHLVTPPAEEPATVAELKTHLQIPAAITAHDAYLPLLIGAARRTAENRTGRAFVTQTWELHCDRFPAGNGRLLLPFPPLSSVAFLKYRDASGALQTWDAANYDVLTGRTPGEIAPAYGLAWPSARLQADAVQIRYVAGYGAAADLPETAKLVVLLIAAALFEDRLGLEPNSPARRSTIEHLLDELSAGDEFAGYAPREEG